MGGHHVVVMITRNHHSQHEAGLDKHYRGGQAAQFSAVEQGKERQIRVAWKGLVLLKVPVEKLEHLPYTTNEGSVPKLKIK